MTELGETLAAIEDNTGRIAKALEGGAFNSGPPSQSRNRYRSGSLHKATVALILFASGLFGAVKAAELNPDSTELIKEAKTEHSPALTLEASKPADFSQSQELPDQVINAAQVTPIGCVPAMHGETSDTICLVLDTWKTHGQPRIIARLASGASSKATVQAIGSELVGGCENLRDGTLKELSRNVSSDVDPSSIGLWPADGKTNIPAKKRLC